MDYNIKLKIIGNEQKPKSLTIELAKIKKQHGSLKTNYESLLHFDGVYYIAHGLYVNGYMIKPEYTAFLKRLEARIEDHLNKLNKDFNHKIEIVI